MSQCRLTYRNGLLGLEKPNPKPETKTHPVFSPVDRKWAKSYLDDICVDVFEAAFRQRRLQPKNRWPYTAQGRLVKQDGVLKLQAPQGRYYPHGTPCPDLQATGISEVRSSFIALPVEIRMQIYRYLLWLQECPEVSSQGDGLRILVRPRNQRSYGASPSILATCRQVNREGTPILYTDNIFQRKFCWPLRWGRRKQYRVPKSQSRRIKSEDVLRISSAQLFRDYDSWLLGTGDLRIFRDFPNLKELRVRVDINDVSRRTNLATLWMDAMKSIDRQRPRLNYVESYLRLGFNREYCDWIESCRGGLLDFSIHRRKKEALEKWMKEEKLFLGQHLAWSFTTSVSEYCGPDCAIEVVIDGRDGATKKTGIPCRVIGDYDTRSIVEED